ncbi:MAG: antitoxin VapB family protein [Verrucomicrobiota bacterium]
MATKTITLELEAYEKLRRAKRGRESFSEVVRRGIFPEAPKSGADLLAYHLGRSRYLSEEDLGAMELAERGDEVAVNPWEEEGE